MPWTITTTTKTTKTVTARTSAAPTAVVGHGADSGDDRILQNTLSH
jgi:hypothetical protein